MRFGYFESELTGYNEDGLPIFDRAENDEFFTRLWRYLIKNGVMSEPADTFMVQASEGMEVTVKKGFAVVQGKFAYGDRVETLTLEPANAIYPRIDAIVIRLDYINRNIVVTAKTGIPSTNPKMPELERTEDSLYELCLATIRVEAQATEIRPGNITDRRSDGSYCGLIEAIGNVADDKVKVVAPVQKGILTYTGDELTPVWSGFDESIMDIAGDVSGYEPGTYTSTFILKAGYIWSDGTPNHKEVEWKIEKKVAVSPVLDQYNFEYDGETQEVTIYNYDSDLMNKTGTESASEAGSYSILFSLKDPEHYKWSSTGLSDSLTLKWSIGIIATPPMLVSNSLTYTGQAIQPTLTAYDSSKINVSVTPKTNVGEYEVVLSLVDPTVMLWESGGTANITLPWSIKKKQFVKPTHKSSPTYSGSAVSVVLNDFDSSWETIEDNTKTDAGSYTAKVTLNDTANTEWVDGTTAVVNIQWSVQILKLPIPTVATNPTFSGSVVSPTLNSFNSTWENITGNSKTDAGTYAATVSLKDPVNTCWADNKTENKTISWEVLKKVLTIPSASSKTYTGLEQIPSPTNYDRNWMSMDYTSQTNVGTYSCVISLNNKASTTWSDGTTTDKTVAWYITKKRISLPYFSSSSYIYYTGSPINITSLSGMNNYDATYMEASGHIQTNVGTYTATFTLLDTDNTEWNKNDQNDVSFSYSIRQKTVSVPELMGASTGAYYTGEEFNILTATSSMRTYLKNFDPDLMNVTGTYKATTIGSYTINITLKDPANYAWFNGGATKSFTWKIVRSTCSISVVDRSTGNAVTSGTSIGMSKWSSSSSRSYKFTFSIKEAQFDQTKGFFLLMQDTSSALYKAITYTLQDNILTINVRNDAQALSQTTLYFYSDTDDENYSAGSFNIKLTVSVG